MSRPKQAATQRLRAAAMRYAAAYEARRTAAQNGLSRDAHFRAIDECRDAEMQLLAVARALAVQPAESEAGE